MLFVYACNHIAGQMRLGITSCALLVCAVRSTIGLAHALQACFSTPQHADSSVHMHRLIATSVIDSVARDQQYQAGASWGARWMGPCQWWHEQHLSRCSMDACAAWAQHIQCASALVRSGTSCLCLQPNCGSNAPRQFVLRAACVCCEVYDWLGPYRPVCQHLNMQIPVCMRADCLQYVS